MPESEQPIPDVYVDQMRLTVGVFGVNLTFGLAEPHPTQGGVPRAAEEKVRVRMSLEHAKTVAMLLRKHLKEYEERFAVSIPLPAAVYTGLGIAEEDWR